MKHSVIIVLLNVSLAAAASKPNFSGKWELNTEKSDLGGTAISSCVVQVEHNDPVFKYTVKGTEDGQDFEDVEAFTTDGKPGTDSHGYAVKTYWEGMTLVSDLTAPGGTPQFQSRLTLSDDGKTITREFIPKGGYQQKRHEIYEKQ